MGSVFDEWMPEEPAPQRDPDRTVRMARQPALRSAPRSRPVRPTRPMRPTPRSRLAGEESAPTVPRVRRRRLWHGSARFNDPRPVAPASRPDYVAARSDNSVLFSLEQLQALEVKRQQERGGLGPRTSSQARTDPRIEIDQPPPPLPLGIPDAVPRNRSFVPVVLATCILLLGGLGVAVLTVARNASVVAPPPGQAAPRVSPQTERLGPAGRGVSGRTAAAHRGTAEHKVAYRPPARTVRALASSGRRHRASARRRRARTRRQHVRARRQHVRARRRRARARRRRARARRARKAAAVTPSRATPSKKLPSIDELIEGGTR